MTNAPTPSGLFIYAKALAPVATFYERVLGLTRHHERSEVVVLDGPGLQLVIHEIPAHIASTFTIGVPPEPREDCALKFFFTVPSLERARETAAAYGGSVGTESWSGPGFVAVNGIDPEGNIFQLREPRAAM